MSTHPHISVSVVAVAGPRDGAFHQPVAVDRRATVPPSVVAVAGPATEILSKRSEPTRLLFPQPVILSLSKDQFPESLRATIEGSLTILPSFSQP